MKANFQTSPARIDRYYAPLYYRHDSFPYVLAASLKCGSSSLNHVCKRNRFKLLSKEYRRDDPVLLIVRHPLDRLVSAYGWFVLKNNIRPHSNGRQFNCNSFEEFVAFTEREPNAHWNAQTWQHPRWREFELIPLGELSAYWDKHWAADWGPFDHRKQVPRQPWREYYDDALFRQQTARYLEDLEAYEHAVAHGLHTR